LVLLKSRAFGSLIPKGGEEKSLDSGDAAGNRIDPPYASDVEARHENRDSTRGLETNQGKRGHTSVEIDRGAEHGRSSSFGMEGEKFARPDLQGKLIPLLEREAGRLAPGLQF